MDIKSELDLSGKLIIKVQLGDDIRRIPIHNESITYDELVLMMQRVFRGKLTANDDIVIKYKDEDGDLITIFESNDLAFAIQCNILNSDIIKNDSCALNSNEVSKLKKQLRTIRDEVNKLLDSIDTAEHKCRNVAHQDQGDAANADNSQASTSLNKVNSSEFDPLQEKNQKNGTEDGKDPSKPPTPQVNSEGGGGSSSRPQSVSMTAAPQQQQQPQSVVTSAGNPHGATMSDYFGRSSTAANFPGMQYSSLPYPQQYNFPTSAGRYVPQVMDSSGGGAAGYPGPRPGRSPTPSSSSTCTPVPPVRPTPTPKASRSLRHSMASCHLASKRS
nr:unnamed protein product [Callosobruchus chinensis]